MTYGKGMINNDVTVTLGGQSGEEEGKNTTNTNHEDTKTQRRHEEDRFSFVHPSCLCVFVVFFRLENHCRRVAEIRRGDAGGDRGRVRAVAVGPLDDPGGRPIDRGRRRRPRVAGGICLLGLAPCLPETAQPGIGYRRSPCRRPSGPDARRRGRYDWSTAGWAGRRSCPDSRIPTIIALAPHRPNYRSFSARRFFAVLLDDR